MKLYLCCAGVALVIGCGVTDAVAPLTVAPLTPAQLCARKDSVLAKITARTIDDEFEVLAHLLPGGFGGLTGSYIFFKHVELADTARATAKTLSQCSGEVVWFLSNVQFALARQGDYDWIELRGWYLRLLTGAPFGMTTADMDERNNRLSFGFMSDSALAVFRTRAESLGVPLAALSLSVHPGPTPLDDVAAALAGADGAIREATVTASVHSDPRQPGAFR
ncbi:MAG: hypothetical protein Q8K55_00130 [Gemmatimonadaceae bacterium]|nr:hypothetical protein [Gemmatimonadaceae bacterium]